MEVVALVRRQESKAELEAIKGVKAVLGLAIPPHPHNQYLYLIGGCTFGPQQEQRLRLASREASIGPSRPSPLPPPLVSPMLTPLAIVPRTPCLHMTRKCAGRAGNAMEAADVIGVLDGCDACVSTLGGRFKV